MAPTAAEKPQPGFHMAGNMRGLILLPQKVTCRYSRHALLEDIPPVDLAL
jgi:hypothetical protein